MKDRRAQRDRRAFSSSGNRLEEHNRRRQPDRRLNNIVVEWIPMGRAHIHPVTRRMLDMTRRIFRTT